MPQAPIGSGFKVAPSVPNTTIQTPQQDALRAKAATPVAPPVTKPAVVAPEVKVEGTKPAQTPEQVEMNRRFNALVAKERSSSQRAMQQSKQAEKQSQRIAQLEQQIAALQPKPASREELQNDLKAQALKNPLEAMKSLGFNYEQLTDFVLNDGKTTPELVENRMQREIEAIRAENKLRDDQFKAQQAQATEQANQQAAQQYQQALDQVKLEITDFVKARPDDFALVAKNEANDTVFEVMSQHYNNTGRIMQVEEACKLVEEYFEEQALDLFKVAKLQAKLGASSASPATQTNATSAVTPAVVGNEAAPQTKPKWVPTTLTHQIATDGTAKPVKEILTPAQRKAKVLARLMGPG